MTKRELDEFIANYHNTKDLYFGIRVLDLMEFESSTWRSPNSENPNIQNPFECVMLALFDSLWHDFARTTQVDPVLRACMNLLVSFHGRMEMLRARLDLESETRSGWNDYYMTRWNLLRQDKDAAEIHRRMSIAGSVGESCKLMVRSVRHSNPTFNVVMRTMEDMASVDFTKRKPQ